MWRVQLARSRLPRFRDWELLALASCVKAIAQLRGGERYTAGCVHWAEGLRCGPWWEERRSVRSMCHPTTMSSITMSSRWWAGMLG